MKNKVDKNGRPHGLWGNYYPDGKLYYRGNYKNGIAHGLFEWYYSSGEVRWKGALKREIRVGLWHHPSK